MVVFSRNTTELISDKNQFSLSIHRTTEVTAPNKPRAVFPFLVWTNSPVELIWETNKQHHWKETPMSGTQHDMVIFN